MLLIKIYMNVKRILNPSNVFIKSELHFPQQFYFVFQCVKFIFIPFAIFNFLLQISVFKSQMFQILFREMMTGKVVI